MNLRFNLRIWLKLLAIRSRGRLETLQWKALAVGCLPRNGKQAPPLRVELLKLFAF